MALCIDHFLASINNTDMGYARHAIRGVGWNTILKILTAVVTAGKIFVLARLLSPTDFGLFSLVAIALGIIEATTETGINTTILQSKKSVGYFLDTAWVIAIFRGLVISILMILIGFAMQRYYQEQALFFLVSVASFVPFIKGFINPAIIALRKDLRFFQDSVYNFSLVVVDAVFAIIGAFLLHSVFAFIYAMIIAAIFEVGISFFIFRDRPHFHYLANRAREIFANAKGLNISAILSYLVQNVDNLLIGKIVGVTPLGIYANGYSLSHKLNLEFAKSVQHAVFPVYVRITDDAKRLQRAFWRSTGYSLLGITLLSLPLFLFPKTLVTLFLSSKWDAVVPILRPLLIAGLIQGAITLASNVMIARQQYVWTNLAQFVNVVVLVPLLFILGGQAGLTGAVYAVLISRMCTLPFVGLGIWHALYHEN